MVVEFSILCAATLDVSARANCSPPKLGGPTWYHHLASGARDPCSDRLNPSRPPGADGLWIRRLQILHSNLSDTKTVRRDSNELGRAEMSTGVKQAQRPFQILLVEDNPADVN